MYYIHIYIYICVYIYIYVYKVTRSRFSLPVCELTVGHPRRLPFFFAGRGALHPRTIITIVIRSIICTCIIAIVSSLISLHIIMITINHTYYSYDHKSNHY